MTVRSTPVSTLEIVTVTPGSTPPEVSDTVPSMAPFAAVDCADAVAVNASADTNTAKKYFSINASIQTIGEWVSRRCGESAVESEHVVARIHFAEVLAQHDPAGEIRT